MSRLLFVLAVAAGNAVLGSGLPAPAPAGAGSTSPELRPDLVQRTPTKVSVRGDAARFALGFDAAVENHAAGPLLVNATARRPDPRWWPTSSSAVATARARVAGMGRNRYTRSGGHDHWHLLRAVRY